MLLHSCSGWAGEAAALDFASLAVLLQSGRTIATHTAQGSHLSCLMLLVQCTGGLTTLSDMTLSVRKMLQDNAA